MSDIFVPYQAFIFDLDGTLVDSMPSHIKAWTDVAQELGFTVDPQEIYNLGGVSSRDVVLYFIDKGHKIDNIDQVVKRKVELYRQHINSIKVFDDIASILINGKKAGKKIAIATGTQKINALDLLEKHKLMPFVDTIISSEDVTKHKPHPQTFLEACNKLNVSVSQALVFEDAIPGIKAAIAGGFDYTIVKNGKFTEIIKNPNN